ECYAPNAASRILDREGRIAQIVNNYSRISFNFGPTLFSWLESNAPEVYQGILAADAESQRTFSGHGSALAQAYNHVIMPLANHRDKHTQVVWGIQDFQHRFGRFPEGMWLPETAVDLDTLEILAELGINFTILAPHQAKRVRPIGAEGWVDVSEGTVDPTMAYILCLPSGRTINLMFFDWTIHRAVTSEHLLSRGGNEFAERLLKSFGEAKDRPQLVHMAADGESYGHHHDYGDMALAYALYSIEANDSARITNYGEFLERHPPTHEVQVQEDSSWTCPHGVERWRGDCGCNSGTQPGWNQAWRAPLREALDWLRDTLASSYAERGSDLLKDPWLARQEYISVILDRSPANASKFFRRHARGPLSDPEKVTALKLLEQQRHAMLMYTSCGWYFDELSGIETVQVIQYAARAIQLAQDLFPDDVEPRFLQLLGEAKSNLWEYQDGRAVYERFAKPAMMDLIKVGAHYAVSSLFEEYSSSSRIFSYTMDLEDYQTFESGRAKLAVGRARGTHEITAESALLSFGVLHFGDHNVNAGVREYQGEEAYQSMVIELSAAFGSGEFPEVIRAMDRHFGDCNYSVRSLFKDEQRKVLDQILESTLAGVEATYRQHHEVNYPLMRFLADLGAPVPNALRTAAEVVVNTDLRASLAGETLDEERIGRLLEDASAYSLHLDTEGLGYLFHQTLERMMERLMAAPGDLALLERLGAALGLAQSLPFDVDLWRVQNLYYRMAQSVLPAYLSRAPEGDITAQEWVKRFISLGEQLSVKVT
ncbi:MAG: DUF3536 domain-containing protein, partial [Dehalococcoidia bacterium]